LMFCCKWFSLLLSIVFGNVIWKVELDDCDDVDIDIDFDLDFDIDWFDIKLDDFDNLDEINFDDLLFDFDFEFEFDDKFDIGIWIGFILVFLHFNLNQFIKLHISYLYPTIFIRCKQK
jgi:hypothetical protein